ncbi:cytochrome c peroxidase [Paucibacter sp. APW11]|uniref:Cytochrome c peroxidase n=1 Tax=Roseateles aquae TaxID=3077235 RepID=A0ABU3PBK8_9BURK|nr:cytochrome c peroxidase [Paucibacter sp. APW11]MDT8999518.1 cytochrome c peroxidase [Paucibacter sp. APW11]
MVPLRGNTGLGAALVPLLASALLALTGCGGGSGGGGSAAAAVDPASPAASTPTPSTPPSPPLSALAQLGALVYVDKTLSASGQQSCASCHDPAAFHGPPNAFPVQPGGAAMERVGTRATPSLRYLQQLPAFFAGDGNPANVSGGLMADGRVDTLAQQARLPFLNPREMANASPAELAARLRQTRYAQRFTAGPTGSDEAWIKEATDALMAFQLEDPQFHPYSSRYDWLLANKGLATPAEQRGLSVFISPQQGNCIGCHAMPEGVAPKALFTNFGYAALGVPRNSALHDNADPSYFDLGLCGPVRSGVKHQDWCGLFRTPTVRNSAKRPVFFHNGVFTSLAQVLDFYNSRDNAPQRWYPQRAGQPDLYNDLPLALRGNVSQQAPFGGGATPPMNAQQLKDLQCFLETLSDGYVPGSPPGPSCD